MHRRCQLNKAGTFYRGPPKEKGEGRKEKGANGKNI